MSTIAVARAALRWHIRKARRTFELVGRAVSRGARTEGRGPPTGVRWG